MAMSVRRTARRLPASRLATAIAIAALALSLLPEIGATAARSPSIASIRYIYHGLTVQPPHAGPRPGRVRQSLFASYYLQTLAQQKASLTFADRTVLHMNQRTDVVLKSPHLTVLKSGEVEELDAPGTNHEIQTDAAIATATGTAFDVAVSGSTTVVTVVEGAVLVSNRFGSVVVTTGQRTTVRKGHAPSSPTATSTAIVKAWTHSLPAPHPALGMNVALSANGGSIITASSQRDATGFAPEFAIDGRLDRGWQSAAGMTSNQWLEIKFAGDKSYHLVKLVLDCAATGGQPAADDLNAFRLEASDSSSGQPAFATILSGVCGESIRRQIFTIGGSARAVRLDAISNHGGGDGIAIAEVEVFATNSPDRLGTPTPAPQNTPTSTPIPTPTLTPTPRATATATLTSPTQAFIPPLSNQQCNQSQRFCAFYTQNRNYACDLAAGPPDQSGNTPFICAGTPIGACPAPSFQAGCAPKVGFDSSGRFLLCIDAAEVNEYGPPFNSSPADFRVQDPGGAVYPTVAGDALPGLQPFTAASISQGQENVGWLCFAIPPRQATYAFQWNDHVDQSVPWQTMGTVTVQ